MKIKRFNIAFFLWIIVLLVVFIFLIPPFQKPDEVSHFYRATALAKGEIVCQNDKNGQSYFQIPNVFFNFPDKMFAEQIRYQYNVKFSKSAFFAKENDNINNNKVKDICSFPFIGYIPISIGMIIGVLLNNPIVAFYLGRISAAAVFIICVLFSLKIIPKKYKNIIYLYTLIPMVLHQVTEISYDVLPMSLVVVIFSLLLKILSSSIRKKIIVIFLALIIILTLAKGGYSFFLLLYFLIPYKKIANRVFNYFIFTIIYFALAIFLNFISFKIVVALSSATALVNPALQTKFIMQNPLLFISTLLHSFAFFGADYFNGFIGIFGWADYGFNFFIYVVYFAIFLFTTYFLIERNKPLINKKQLLLLISIIAAILLTIFTSLYLVWSPVGSSLVQGVQGRYFLVLFPFFIFAIVQFALIIGKKNFYILVVFIFSMFLTFNLVFNIYNRYYNYAYLYSNQGSLEKNMKQLKSSHINKVAIPIKQSYRFVIENLNLDRKIGGFEFIFNSSKKVMATPYEYYVKDGQCKKIYEHGFLSIGNLQNSPGPKLYDEKFGNIIKLTDSKMCVVLIPFEKPAGGQYINLYSLNKKILFDFLLISN